MIKTEKQYTIVVERIEELLKHSENIENTEAKGYIELNFLADMVADYEETNHPVPLPSLVDAMKLRMYEMKLNQVKLSDILGVSTSRVSEYLTGKSEPPLKVARDISVKLNIDPIIVLGN